MLAEGRIKPFKGHAVIRAGAGRTERSAEDEFIAVVEREGLVVAAGACHRKNESDLLPIGEDLIVGSSGERHGRGSGLCAEAGDAERPERNEKDFCQARFHWDSLELLITLVKSEPFGASRCVVFS